MAYASADLKAKLEPQIKALAKQYGIKATMARKHTSTIVLNIQKGSIDFINEQKEDWNADKHYTTVYHKNVVRQFKEGTKALEFMKKAVAIIDQDNHDNSNIMVDYFDVGYYVDINIGKWDKPYQLI